MIFVGSLAFAGAGYRLILPPAGCPGRPGCPGHNSTSSPTLSTTSGSDC